MDDWFLVIVGTGVVALMLAQQLVISRNHDNTEISEILEGYKLHVRVASALVVLGFFAQAMFYVLIFLGVTRDPAAGAHADARRSLLSFYEPLFGEHKGVLSLFVTATFAGAVRLALDRAADESSSEWQAFFRLLWTMVTLGKRRRKAAKKPDADRRDDRKPETAAPSKPEEKSTLGFARKPEDETDSLYVVERRKKQQDTWVWWFIVTTIAEVGYHIASNLWSKTHPDSAQSHELRLGLLVLGVNSAALLTYLAWVYLGLFRQMTEVHRFSGLATRKYLGELFESKTPLQVVVIGPKEAGKSTFVESQQAQYVTDSNGNNLQNTPRLRVKNYPVTVGEGSDEETRYSVTAIDTPGENLGDHLSAVSYYRADVLVLVLRASHLNLEAFEDRDFHLKALESICKLCDGSRKKTHDYAQALALALTRSEGAAKPEDVFVVRNFMILINCETKEEFTKMQKLVDENPQMQRVAEEWGRLFGVPQEDTAEQKKGGIAFAHAWPATQAAREHIVYLSDLKHKRFNRRVNFDDREAANAPSTQSTVGEAATAAPKAEAGPPGTQLPALGAQAQTAPQSP